jgi:hypothetical protein
MKQRCVATGGECSAIKVSHPARVIGGNHAPRAAGDSRAQNGEKENSAIPVRYSMSRQSNPRDFVQALGYGVTHHVFPWSLAPQKHVSDN